MVNRLAIAQAAAELVSGKIPGQRLRQGASQVSLTR
jgi:hypothetical protein